MQFFSARLAHVISLAATAQLCLYCIAILTVDSFIVVVLNYAPAMLWLLIMNVLQLRTGRGNWQLITGTCLLFIASAVQAAGVDVFAPVDHNGLYHLVSMPALLLLFFGGRGLDTVRPRPEHSPRSAA